MQIRTLLEQILLEEIEGKWAVGPNASKAQNTSFSRNPQVTVVYVNPMDVIKNMPPSFRVSPNSSVNHIGNRMEKAMDHLMTPGTYMDPSFVAYNYYLADSKEFPLLIDDGRHRLAAAAKLGLRKVPIWVMKEQVEDIAKVIRVYKN